MRRLLAAILLLSATPALAAERLLFIGNSYTAQWGVAAMVSALLGPEVEAVDISRYNVTLDWHLHEGEALARIAEAPWAMVILQDFSDTALRPDKAAVSERALTQLTDAAKDQGAQLAYFANWTPAWVAEAEIPARQAQIKAFYEAAAARHGGVVAPVGLAWLAAPDLALRADDRHHATPLGAYLAALVIARTIAPVLGLEAPSFPPWHPVDVSAPNLATIWRAALASRETP